MSHFDDQKDAVKLVREFKLLCETCYGRQGGLAGAAMTPWECRFCGGKHVAGSTATDSCCKGCALLRGVCEHCGRNPHIYQNLKVAMI